MLLYALWAIVGWCGTPPGRIPIPDPDPEPWWFTRIAAVVGGILGGLLVRRLVSGADTEPVVAIATSIGAFALGRVLSDIVGNVMGGRRRVDVAARG